MRVTFGWVLMEYEWVCTGDGGGSRTSSQWWGDQESRSGSTLT